MQSECLVDVIIDCKWSSFDAFIVLNSCCSALCSETEQLPYLTLIDFVDTLNRTVVKVQVVLLQHPQEQEPLVSLLDGDVGGPGQTLHDVGPQKLETGDTLDSHPIHVDGVMS